MIPALRKVSLLFVLTSALVSACQGAPTQITPASPVRVDLPPNASQQIFTFTANPASATTLRFDSAIPGAPFAAEIRDGGGQVVAALGGGALQTAYLTIGPASGNYQVVLSTGSSGAQGSVVVSIVPSVPDDAAAAQTAAQAAPAAPAPNSTPGVPAAAAQNGCTITVTHPGGVNVRRVPNFNAEILEVLPPNGVRTADARTSGGWYHVAPDGWVYGDVVRVEGACAALPVQPDAPYSSRTAGGTTLVALAQTAGVPSAPYDADSFYFSVDADSGGAFSEALSYPDGDGTDRILLAISGLPFSAGQRPFVLVMDCASAVGEAGTAALRWGTPGSAGFICGQRVGVTFSGTFDRQQLVVNLPSGARNYVEYTLRAYPVAPDDPAVVGLGIDSIGGGVYSDMLSAPQGDAVDTLQLQVINLTAAAPDRYRDVLVTVQCAGDGADGLRWGLAADVTALQAQVPTGTSAAAPVVRACGESLLLPFSYTASVQTLMLALTTSGYVSYTLRAQPVALPDGDGYVFGFDRDSGGQFNETLSLPGDQNDLLWVTVNNLTPLAPNDQRTVMLGLRCAGTGTDGVRWGTTDNPTLGCNMTLTLPLTYAQNGVLVNVGLMDGYDGAYVNYSLFAVTAP